MKYCNKCQCFKDYSEFNKDRLELDGLNFYCRECRKTNSKQFYQKNKLKFKISSQKYRLKNKEKIQITKAINYQKNKAKYLQNKKLYYSKNKINILIKHKVYQVNQRHNNINFRLVSNLRSRLNLAIKNNSKFSSISKVLGCSIEYLKKHLENQFKEGMNWQNYGLKGWHIDHIKPCASFDLSNPKEQAKCFHYSNLQPLWAEENIRKGKHYV
jgi:hypothetical protein